MKKICLVSFALLAAACSGDENLFSGSIEIDEIRVSARVGGLITEVRVKDGDEVIFGQVLIKLDESQYFPVVAQSRATVAAAEARLETLLEGTRRQQVLSASALVEAARAERAQRESDLMRARELFAAGALSEQGLQAAETAVVAAASNFNSAVQAHSLAAEGSRSTEILAGQAAVALAEATLQLAVNQLEWTTVTSPSAGTVTGIDILEGENIPAGMTLLTVAPMDTVHVVFYLSEPLLTQVAVGDPIQVIATNAEPVVGVLSRISDRAEFTPSSVETRDGRTSLVYRVEGTVPNPDRVFKEGMPVDVRIGEKS